MNALVIAPHPDDEVLGVGGTLALLSRAGQVVNIAYLTSGELGGMDLPGVLSKQREEEARVALKELSIDPENAHFLRFPDGGIDANSRTQMDALISLLRALRPRTVFIPHRHDGGRDHQSAHALSWEAIGLAATSTRPELGRSKHWSENVFAYEVWTPLRRPTVQISIDEVVDLKLRALGAYQSQTAKSKGGLGATHVGGGDAALPLNAWRGSTTIGGHREAFEALRVSPLMVLGEGHA